MRFEANLTIVLDLEAAEGLDADVASGIIRYDAIASKAGEFGKAVATATEGPRFRVGHPGTAFASIVVDGIERV